ncbi:MAG: type II toxin-antitoxin system RelE/ParE family toxin [Bifidobacteriaceae bacterium]|nr:type II toxin-antitoxin system RelE/ParE family toxin [Bifidobacteriaceae bacterium]
MRVILHRLADKRLERIHDPDKRRINRALDGLEENPPVGDIRPVVGQKGLFRLKVGDYRILFHKDFADIIFVTQIKSRGEVYKNRR